VKIPKINTNNLIKISDNFKATYFILEFKTLLFDISMAAKLSIQRRNYYCRRKYWF
jgi:hypothetical protein